MTTNPIRKWTKKLRNAKTHEQTEKAEQMLKVLTKTTSVKPESRALTDDEIMDLAKKSNKKMFAHKQEKDLADQKEKTRSLKASQLRKALREKKIADAGAYETALEAAQEKVINDKMAYDMFFKRLKDHEAIMKVQFSDKLDAIHANLLDKNNQNKKKTKKEYKRIIDNQPHMIELLIQEHMETGEEDQEMSYGEAQKFIYSEMFSE